MAGWGLVAFVVLLSGVLAYYGDVIGRKMGKKRLVIGRLRPRHTAAIMTAVFGMLGAAVAIGALLLVSEPVRKMLFEGERVRRDLDRMEREQTQLRRDLDSKQDELVRTQTDVRTEQNKVSAERKKVGIAQRDVASLRQLAQTLRNQATSIRGQLASVRRQLSTIKTEYERIKTEKDRVEAAKNYANTELNKINDRNLKLEAEIKEKETKANARIADLQKNIDELNRSFNELQEAFARQANSNREEMKTLRQEVDTARDALSDAKSELAATKAEIENLGDTAAISRIQPLIFSRDDELARLPVRSRLNAAEARAYLLAAMEQASASAKAAGAKPSTPSGSEAVLPERRGNNQKIVTAEEQIQTLTQRLVNVGQEQVILASAIFNSFQGEPVGLNIRILPNPVVYRKDQIIAETKIDGQMSQDLIVQAISRFLERELAPKARKDGMIPMMGTANPLGEFNQEDLFKLVAEIRSRPFTSRVKFVASQDTRAADRLKMEFRVS